MPADSAAAQPERPERGILKDLPCMRCLQAFTRNIGTVVSGHLCVYEPMVRCQRCVDHRKRNKDCCDRVPTLFETAVSHIKNLVDTVHTTGTPKEVETAALNDIVYCGNEVRRAWARLIRDIKTGKLSWEEVQEFGVERYTEEEVEAFIARARAKESANEQSGDRESEGDDSDDGDDYVGNNEPPATQSSPALIETVNQIHQTVATTSNALISSQEEVQGLLQEVVRLQEEMVEGQKNLLESQIEMIKELKSLNTNCERKYAAPFAYGIDYGYGVAPTHQEHGRTDGQEEAW